MHYSYPAMAADTSGNTPLHIAASHGHQQTVRKLLTSHKHEVNCLDSEYRPLLHLACYQGHTDIVRTLLCEFGMDVNARGQDNDTPLHQAALGGHTDVVCALINEFGCSPQVRGFEGRTLLHYACNKGLLHQPCQGGQNDTPLYQAAIGGHTNVVCAHTIWSEGGSKRAHH